MIGEGGIPTYPLKISCGLAAPEVRVRISVMVERMLEAASN